MSEQQRKLDPTPLVKNLVEKSRIGKLNWEPTSDREAFIASVGGETSFRIQLITVSDIGDNGQWESFEIPRLDMLDQKGHLLWDIHKRDVMSNDLWDLFYIARRIGNRLDDRIEGAIGALDKL